MIDYAVIELHRRRLGVRKAAISKSTGIHSRRLGVILSGMGNPRINELEAICREVGLTLAVVLKTVVQ